MVNGGGKQNNDKDEDPIMSVFDEIDLNNDGVISKEEFRIAVEKMRHLDVLKMKRSLASNDISFNHKASVLGRTVLISDEFDAWQFMKGLPDYKHVSHLCPPVALPPRSSNSLEHTLVLDMDETLLHCSVDEPSSTDRDPDHTFEVGFQGSKYLVHSWLRPHLHEFLDKVSENFEVVIFTASQAAYANVILDILDPGKFKLRCFLLQFLLSLLNFHPLVFTDNKYFHHRLFRESCIEVDGNLVKDLNVLGRDLSKVMMVDNSPHVFGFQIDNGIPIESWFQDMNMDDELHKLEWFLREIQLEDDVRPRIRDKFQVYQLIENAVAVA